MDITEFQRTNHLVDSAPMAVSAGVHSPGIGALWKVSEDNGDGTYEAKRVYDSDSLTNVAHTVYPLPGETLSVGDYGLLATRGDGEWLFFRRRPRGPVIETVAVGGSQRIRVAGTYAGTPWGNYISWRWHDYSGVDHACGYLYKFSEAAVLDETARLWVYAGDAWTIGGAIRCSTNPSVGCGLRCATSLYLIYEDFEESGDEMTWAAFSALSKSTAYGYSTSWWNAEDYYSNPYYIAWGAAREDPTNSAVKFCHHSAVTDQTVYGIAFTPATFLIETYGATLHSSNLSYYFYRSGSPAPNPTDIRCYLSGVV